MGKRERERADCFALFVFLVSWDCCVALPHDDMGCLQFVIVVFPDHTHLLYLKLTLEKENKNKGQ